MGGVTGPLHCSGVSPGQSRQGIAAGKTVDLVKDPDGTALVVVAITAEMP
ncbi:MAG: hypothetical protein ACKO1M_08875 [Planctomycetota bacterium]